MHESQTDPTNRFSNRVENYVRFRPSYPDGVIDVLASETGLTPESEIADVGSGTGISSELFLRNGNTVFGVEPNGEMRGAAERLLADYPRFTSIDGRAEATTLPDHSVDYVVAGQAFHWFEPASAKTEFARILRDNGWVVLIWNSRRVESSPFLQAYEALLERFGTDYELVQHRNIDLAKLRAIFDGEPGNEFQLRTLDNEQRFDLEGLTGRLLSSSYAPTASHPAYKPMLHELKQIFEQYAESGHVTFEYDTEIYFGRVM